ncbi:FitA-like ribbon-helix-helix domain-containing protein [Tundrisphaera sp. TA3]|uniref:FitA-like ribbon-helix-helix domain-containing protein n=1 Tax=Tundrisphaera sp. TA3 TaxID=3435775 RepID=UPI003EC0C4D5
MPDVLIRDLDAASHDVLKRRAEASGRSLQAEIRLILEATARASDAGAARQHADRIRAQLADRVHPDSSSSVREVRDR